VMESKNVNIIDYRERYFPKYYLSCPSMFKLILLLQSDEPKVISKLGAFLKNVLPLFQFHLLYFSYCVDIIVCFACTPYHVIMVLTLSHINKIK